MHRQKVATVLEITYNEAGTYFMLSAKTKTISDGDGNLFEVTYSPEQIWAMYLMVFSSLVWFFWPRLWTMAALQFNEMKRNDREAAILDSVICRKLR